jgi:hypothetical protein
MTPRFAHFESNPARFTDDEAWVCQHDNVWRQMNVGEVRAHAGLMTEERYNATFPNLPPLPNNAFAAS